MNYASQFMTLFAGLDRAHGIYTVNGQSGSKSVGKALTKRDKVTEELWKKHLDGKSGIGIIPIRDDSTAVFGAVDIDSYDSFDPAALSIKMHTDGIPGVVCRSKSGGAHVYLFTSEPITARLMRSKLKQIAIALGYPKAEIFPKQDSMNGQDDIGNWINMPYFGGDMSTRYAIHLGESMSMEEFIEYAKNKSLTQKQVEDIEVSNNEFGDAPPCLETLVASGFPPGSMNNGLFNMGVYARMKFGDDWQKYVFAYNERFMGPGASHEVQQLIKSLDKKKYTYKCHEAPICGVCDKSSCSGREFGPMGEHSPYKSPENKRKFRPCVLDEVDQPIIRFDPPEESDDEPFYVFNIKGKRMTATLEMISHQGKFLHGYLKKFHKVMAAIEVDRWNTKMNELLDGADVKAMAIDGGPEGQFMIYLESFCTKIEARSKDELLQGKPWNDNGKTYFRLMDLMKYLDINRFKTFSQTQLCDILRRRGADHHKFMIKGKCVACWSIEQFKTQTEDFDIPNVSNSAY